MNKLNKSQLEEKHAHVCKINAAKVKLENEITAFNASVEQLKTPVQTAQEELNNVLADANQWLNDRVSEMDGFFEEKSDRWKESKRGETYNEWRDKFDLDLGEVEVNFPAEAEVPYWVDADDLSNLPDAPESPE